MNARSDRRTSQRRRRRRNRSLWGLARIMFAIAVVLILYLGITRVYWNKQSGVTPSAAKKEETLSLDEKRKNTFLVIGVKKEGGKETATGFLQFIIDGGRRSIGGVVIPSNTFVEVSGRGFEPVSDSYGQGIDIIKSTLASFIGIGFSHYLMVSDDIFLSAVNDSDIVSLFKRRSKTDMSSDDVRQVLNEISAVPKEKISLVDLPVKPISFGEQTYFDAKKDELSRVVKLFWGINLESKETKTRLIILNGSGLPGVARKAADNLLGKGFKIVDIKNADNFDYERTQIVIYNDKKAKDAPQIKKLIGLGEVMTKALPQDVVDIVIILGRDYE